MNEDLTLSGFGEQCIKLWEEGSLEPKLEAQADVVDKNFLALGVK